MPVSFIATLPDGREVECILEGDFAKFQEDYMEAVQWIKEYQYQYQPYDDFYHKDQGFYCPECGGEEPESSDPRAGHRPSCSVVKILSRYR